MPGPWEKYASQPDTAPEGPWARFAAPPAEPAKPGLIGSALKPITSLPETYSRMVHEAVGEMGRGVEAVGRGAHEIGSGEFGRGAADIALGAGRAGLGAASYITAPINAPVHTIVGEPVAEATEKVTGSPRAGRFAGGLAEAAATMAVPLPKGAGAVREAAPTVEELKAAAKAGFEAPEIRGLIFSPQAVSHWSDVTKVQLGTQGLDEILAPKTWGILNKLMPAPAGPGVTVTGQNFQTLRRTLGKAAKAADPTERLAAHEVIRALDDFVENPPPRAVIQGDAQKGASMWREARQNYAAAMRTQEVQEAVTRAKDRAGATYSGQNIDNATRQEINRILTNKKVLRGFSKEEIDQMRKIVRGTWAGDLPRFLGNLVGGGGGLNSIAAGGAGALVGGPMGALAVPSIGYAFKKLGNAITAGRVAKLDELLRERSPLAYQTKLSLGGYAQAAQNFQAAGGDMATGIRLLAASRDLANALNEAGIEADPEKLMRAATAPDTQQEPAASRAPGVSIQAATPETIRAQAAGAIARGAPREAVIKRLQDAGYDATGL